MQHSTDTLWTVFTGGGISVIAYLVGGVDNLIIALGVLMAADFISGVMTAFTVKNISSKSAFQGLMKKSAMILAVIVANQLDVITGGTGQFMRNAMLMFLIGTEGISFIENLGKLGVKVPVQISSAFSQLKDKGEDK